MAWINVKDDQGEQYHLNIEHIAVVKMTHRNVNLREPITIMLPSGKEIVVQKEFREVLLAAMYPPPVQPGNAALLNRLT
jgi:uncharacterized protein YlzI (FlbEa/FlbD family)